MSKLNSCHESEQNFHLADWLPLLFLADEFQSFFTKSVLRSKGVLFYSERSVDAVFVVAILGTCAASPYCIFLNVDPGWVGG